MAQMCPMGATKTPLTMGHFSVTVDKVSDLPGHE